MRQVGLVALIVGICLPLQAESPARVRASIPFAFEVADRVIPAGTYTFSFPLDSIGGTFIRSADPAQAIAVAVLGLLGSQADSEAELASVIFNRYEDRHFLARVTLANRKNDIFKSRSEKELVTSRVTKTTSAAPVEVKIVAAVR
jgi:hypothetical protein